MVDKRDEADKLIDKMIAGSCSHLSNSIKTKQDRTLLSDPVK